MHTKSLKTLWKADFGSRGDTMLAGLLGAVTEESVVIRISPWIQIL